MRPSFICSVFLSIVTANSALADFVATWNFNSLNIPSAGTPAALGVLAIASSTGSGTLQLNGWAGNLDDFAGSTVNALAGDPAGASLSLIAGGTSPGPYPGNDSFIVFQTSLSGFRDPVLSFATQRTSTGFTTGTWSWSLDGTNFLAIGSVTPSTSYSQATIDLASIDALDNASLAYFRYTLSGATSSTGNNRIDNFQIQASIAAVPEPPSGLLLVVASCFAFLYRFWFPVGSWPTFLCALNINKSLLANR